MTFRSLPSADERSSSWPPSVTERNVAGPDAASRFAPLADAGAGAGSGDDPAAQPDRASAATTEAIARTRRWRWRRRAAHTPPGAARPRAVADVAGAIPQPLMDADCRT